jgi:hypothetical protein
MAKNRLTMKHYILLSVTVPAQTDAAYGDWLTVSSRLEAIASKSEGLQRLAPNVWLLPRDAGMPFVAECMALASRSNLQAQPRFLNSDE